jgi:hypothetical protein
MPYGSISLQRMSDILPSATHQVTNSLKNLYLKTNKTYTFRKTALTAITLQYNSYNSTWTASNISKLILLCSYPLKIQNVLIPNVMERKTILVTDKAPSHPNKNKQWSGTLTFLPPISTPRCH